MDITAPEVAKQKSIPIFCCYTRKDQHLLLELKTHLMPLIREELITLWADVDINAGTEWEKEIHLHLNAAQIILLLVSPDFLASDYCYSIEMQRALERHECGETYVIPIILRPVSWQETPLRKLQALPTNANPITSGKWHHQDEALLDIVEGIRKAVNQIRTKIPLQKDRDKISANHWFGRLRHASCPLWVLILYIFLSLLAIALLLDQIVIARTIPPGAGISSLEYHDLLNNANNIDTKRESWPIDDHCFFSSDGYHLETNRPISCIEQSVRYQDSSISVNMTVLSPNPAGLIFRNQGNGGNTGYYFEVQSTPCLEETPGGTDGCYHLSTLNRVELQKWTPSPAIHPQGPNFLRVIALGDRLMFFINEQYLTTVVNAQFLSGMVGFACFVPTEHPCKAIFNNLTVDDLSKEAS